MSVAERGSLTDEPAQVLQTMENRDAQASQWGYQKLWMNSVDVMLDLLYFGCQTSDELVTDFGADLTAGARLHQVENTPQNNNTELSQILVYPNLFIG